MSSAASRASLFPCSYASSQIARRLVAAGAVVRVARDHVRHETRVVGPVVLARDDDRVAHPRVLRERRFDLAELDAMPADLHLVIDAAQELEPPVLAPPREVAGPVEPLVLAPDHGSRTKRSRVSSGLSR